MKSSLKSDLSFEKSVLNEQKIDSSVRLNLNQLNVTVGTNPRKQSVLSIGTNAS